jgi:hypothetical protein
MISFAGVKNTKRIKNDLQDRISTFMVTSNCVLHFIVHDQMRIYYAKEYQCVWHPGINKKKSRMFYVILQKVVITGM